VSDAPIGRFVDPTVLTTIDLGDCRCPGHLHDRDSAQLRDFALGEAQSVYGAAVRTNVDGVGFVDEAAGDDLAISRFYVSWTLTGDEKDAKGQPMTVPLAPHWIALLDPPTRSAMIEPINNRIVKLRAQAASLPNGSGAPSRERSRGSASRTRTTPLQR
jgi:hypothetical protein